MENSALFLRQAVAEDIEALEQLLNRCYRQAEGWTHEAALVGGIRTTQDELLHIIDDPAHYLFVYPKTDTGQRDGTETGELLGCIAVDIQRSDDTGTTSSHRKAYIGMFAVHPALQGRGVGHQILQAAETFATRHLAGQHQPAHLTMSILSQRPELLAYYERRGYQLTGERIPFPEDGNNGQPKQQGLQLLTLEKRVTSDTSASSA